MVLCGLSNIGHLYKLHREEILELSINIIALSIIIWTIMQTIRVLIKYIWYFTILIFAISMLIFYV